MSADLTPGQLERVRLEGELEDLRTNVHPFPTPEGIRAHERRIEDLREQLRHLPPVPRDPKPRRLPG